MSTRPKTVYPSPENCQHTNDVALPWTQAAAMLSEIVNAIPEAERQTARIEGWNNLKLVIDHTDTPAEVDALRASIVAEILSAGQNDGLTKEQVAAFSARLNEI